MYDVIKQLKSENPPTNERASSTRVHAHYSYSTCQVLARMHRMHRMHRMQRDVRDFTLYAHTTQDMPSLET